MKYLFLFAGLVLSLSVWAQDTALTVYTGKYTFPAGSSITESLVEVKDGKLFVSSTLGSATLTRQQADTFSVDEYGGQIAFLRSNEKVTGIKVNIPAANLDLEGVKADSTGAAASAQAPFVNTANLQANGDGNGLNCYSITYTWSALPLNKDILFPEEQGH
ncbi:hypothetical protein SAMN04488505_103153 [Chitinophaga rupis]|uniref:Uncharacterized protein n=1 Tax=Chitinophaga rupis TaxID=573321 RepID=A0A1H7UYK5_9BACT|nr:hypothetical protein [Chitinophaga rupis]SEM02052.1 hypothetical protein SAMN04488505_103153 [Chitinophaga rupis]